ncbi:hypothetical protein SBDP2_620007 [Syntrophobacter sp. SbD2]|nr:hypothetical protein SBDP2_620007 [Syntrophobacter sp. SbD2]
MTHDCPLCFRTRPNLDSVLPTENINLGLAHFLQPFKRLADISFEEYGKDLTFLYFCPYEKELLKLR